MGRIIYLAFLGASDYEPVHYYLNDYLSERPLQYVQEAEIDYYKKEGSLQEINEFFFVMTEKSKEKNWLNNKESKYNQEGLRHRLNRYKININPILIPDPSKPEELSTTFELEIFKRLASLIKEEDEIILDITHSFRTIPLTVIVVMDYLLHVKNIGISAVFYGAYEATKIQDGKKCSPIHNLSYMMDLMKWTRGTYSFVKYGIAEELKKLSELNKKDYFSGKNRDEPELKKIKDTEKIIKSIDDISFDFYTVRGRNITERDFNELLKRIENIANLNLEIKEELGPLINKIKEKFDRFKGDKIFNGLKGVEWCIEHNLIQQGITLLLEWLITYLLSLIEVDYSNRIDRDIISSLLHVMAYKKGIEEWKGILNDKKEIATDYLQRINTMMGIEKFRQIISIHERISIKRNDINHGGFLKDSIKKGSVFKTFLEEAYKEIIKILEV